MYRGREVVTIMRGWVVAYGARARKVHFSQGTEVRVGPFSLLFDGLLLTVTLSTEEGELHVTWDGISSVMVRLVGAGHVTCGLCGDNDGDPGNDASLGAVLFPGGAGVGLESFISSWRVDTSCVSVVPTECGIREEAMVKCTSLFSQSSLGSCAGVLDLEPYLAACVQDLCSSVSLLPLAYPGECGTGAAYMARCSLIDGGDKTAHQAGCPSTRGLQTFAVSIGCPQLSLPFLQ